MHGVKLTAQITAQMGPVWTVHMHTEASGDDGSARGQWQDAIPTSITTQRSSIAARCGHLLVARKWASVLVRCRLGAMARLYRAALQAMGLAVAANAIPTHGGTIC